MLKHSFAALLISAALPAAAEPLNYNVVEFSESAGIEVPRDTMSARFSVRAEGKTREAVNAAFVKKFNTFNRQAKNKAFKTELLNRNASPRYQYSNGKQIQTGWTEMAEFKVESKDFAALNRLIADTQEAANVEYTRFSVSKQKREEVIDEVSKTAILRFKARAKSLANTLGFSGYKIVKLDLGHIGNASITAPVQMKFSRAAALSADMESMDAVSPGSEEINITVSGSIQM